MEATHQPVEGALRVERAVVFAAVAAAVVFYALRGGTYDLVLRQEAGVAIWWTIALGFAIGVLPRARPARLLAVPLAGFATLVLWTALAHGWTESDERTTAELARTVHHAGVLLLALCLLGPRTWSAAIGGALTGMGIVCALAVASRLYPGSFPADAVRENFPTNRLNYPLNYWNAVSAWAAVTVALALPVSAHARSHAARALALAVVPVAVVMAYLTYSRGGVLGISLAVVAALVLGRHRLTTLVHLLPAAGASGVAIAAVRGEEAIAEATGGAGGGRIAVVLILGCAVCAAFAAVTRIGRIDERLRVPRRMGRSVLAVGAAVAAIAGVVLLPGVIDSGWDEFRNQSVGTVDSADPAARLTNLNGARYVQFDAALGAFESQPVHGIGPGTYEFWWNREGDEAPFIRDAHSLYLETLAELGIVGGLALLVLLAGALALIVLALRHLPDGSERGLWAACLGGLLVSLLHASFEWIWEATANAVVLLLLAGAGAAALHGAHRGPPAVPWRVAGVVVAISAVLVQLPALVSTSKLRESQAAVLRGDEQAAAAAAADALETQPWAASPYVQRALLAERAGRFDLALDDVRRAEERERTNWRHPLLRARILAEQGKPREALKAFRAAAELRPRSNRFGG
jgi:hypothetical protein